MKTNNLLKVLIIIPMLNLCFMHYYFYFAELLEWEWKCSEIMNLLGVIFDMSIITLTCLIVLRGRLKPALAIAQILTLIWSFVNVMYGKFFYQYLPLSAINEVHGLGDKVVINSIISGFKLYDIFYLLSIIGFVIVYIKTPSYKCPYKMILRLCLIPIISLTMAFSTYSVYHFLRPLYRNNWDSYILHAHEFLYDPFRGGTPNLCHFQIGSVRVALYEVYDLFHSKKLTVEQKKTIQSYFTDYSQRTTNIKRNPEIKNVIFILLESFLSAPIDLIVDGKEITPFLNSLKKDPNVLYNGNMLSDISCGESGDGQFIYMTGLLPLKNKVTVGQVKNHILPGLPKLLKKKLNIVHSEISFPTKLNFWQQEDMNALYGINHAYSLKDMVGNDENSINDERIFCFATEILDKSKEPFFSMILSLSTHGPYDNYVGEDLHLKDESLSLEYKNYLNTCHYTDSQLMKYISALKSKDLYNNSLIVISSDHYAHVDLLKMQGKISRKTPLFIVNGLQNNCDVWSGDFHQLDVYTTLLNILDLRPKWRGLGHTLLNPQYTNSVNKEAENISKWIIESDYFIEDSGEL